MFIGCPVDGQQEGGFKATVAACDEPAAVGDGDGRSPAVALDHGGDGGDLRRRVGVRVLWVGLQVGHIGELVVGAMDFHSAEGGRKGTVPREIEMDNRLLQVERMQISVESLKAANRVAKHCRVRIQEGLKVECPSRYIAKGRVVPVRRNGRKLMRS